MKTTLSLLNDLQVATPCSADWEQMPGTDQVRHCQQCNLNVYNLSHMTEAAATALIVEKEGHLCVRFYRRADGTLLTRDCPVGLPVRAWRQARYVALTAFSLVAWLFTVGCEPDAKPTTSSKQVNDNDQAKSTESTKQSTESEKNKEAMCILGGLTPPTMGNNVNNTNPPPVNP